MFKEIATKMGKDIGFSSLESGDIDSGIAYIEKYLSDLDKDIASNSDNERFTIEKNQVLDKFKKSILNIAQIEYGRRDWIKCLKCCQLLIKYNTTDNSVFKHAFFCFRYLEKHQSALELIDIYAKREPDDPMNEIYLGEAMVDADKSNAPQAIELFKNYMRKHPTDPHVLNSLGHAYAFAIDYDKPNYKDQLYYFEKAYEYDPNHPSIMRNLVLTYEKMNDFEKAFKLMDRWYNMHKDHLSYNEQYDYACSMLRRGNFIKGWQLLDTRFKKETLPTIYPNINRRAWNGESNISKDILLVHFEQGFGDVIMYIRFVKEMKKYAREVIAVVQDELLPLFRESNLGFMVFPQSVDLNRLEFDCHIPLISLPRVLKITPTTIPYTEGYLTVDSKRKEMYGRDFVKTDKFKVGINFEGAKIEIAKEQLRDLDWKYVCDLAKIEGIQLYCLNREKRAEDFKKIDENLDIVCLGETFRNFADTAAAIKNMDLVITTDSGILNLAGALGVKTFALFNQNRECRWYGTEEGKMIWYDSVKPFQAKLLNEWQPVIDTIVENIKQLVAEKTN